MVKRIVIKPNVLSRCGKKIRFTWVAPQMSGSRHTPFAVGRQNGTRSAPTIQLFKQAERGR